MFLWFARLSIIAFTVQQYWGNLASPSNLLLKREGTVVFCQVSTQSLWLIVEDYKGWGFSCSAGIHGLWIVYQWQLKARTLLVIVKDQSSHLVYLNIWMKKNRKFGPHWSSKLWENTWRKKHPHLSSYVLSDAMNLRLLIQLKLFEWDIVLLSQKFRYFRGSLFSSCFFYTINSSLLLVYQVSSYATNSFE